MRCSCIEPLESRCLLSGVTLVTHGRLGHIWGFVQTVADSITKRLGGPAEAPQYLLTLTPDSSDGHLVPSVTHVSGSGTPQTSSSGEILLLVDWTSVDANTSYSLPYVASVITDVFMNLVVGGVRLAELPLHGISISRGTGLLDEISRSLGKSGVWVDQETYCDPNPVEVMGDASPTVYDNVAFVDNYWRWDGNTNNTSTNGSPVNGAYNLNVQWLDDQSSGWALKHLAPGGYYVGTIDLSATNGGEGPIYTSWYGNGHPDRDKTGFFYSGIVGGSRPVAGVWPASGGTGARTATGQQGAQWANVADVNVIGGSTFASGQTLQIGYIQQDRDSASTITFYLDPDRNPYNNNFAHVIGATNNTQSSVIAAAQTTGQTTGIGPGAYYVVAKSSDPQGHVRYGYSGKITITAPISTVAAPPAPVLSSPVIAGNGVSVNWTISSNTQNGFRLERRTGTGGSWAQIASVDAGTFTFNDSAISANTTYFYRAYAYNLAGNSTLSNEVSIAIPALSEVYVSGLAPLAATSGYGPYEKDTSNGELAGGDGKTLTLNGKTYGKGLGVHANSSITYSLGGQYTRFLCDVGVDDEAGSSGSVIFRVWLDNVKVFDSGVMTGSSATKSVDVGVSGANQLRLEVTDAGDGKTYDHADWAGAKLVVLQATPPPMAPSGLSAAYNPQSGRVDLSWSDSAGDQTGFRIERKLESGGTYAGIATVSSSTFGFSDPGPFASSSSYTYRIIATNAGGDSAPSNERTVAIPRDVSLTFLSDITPLSALNGYGPYEKDASNGESAAGDGGTLTLNGVTYAKGLGVHARSDISFNLANQYTQFLAEVGIDDEAGNHGSVVFQVYLDGVKAFETGRITGADAAQTIAVDTQGKNTLRLVVSDSGDGNAYDHADWANARLTAAQPPVQPVTTYLSSLTPTSATNGYGPYEKDRSNGELGSTDGHTLTLNGVTYAKGLGVHALSDITFNLNQQYRNFFSEVGIDDEVGSAGSVIFQVFVDSAKVFDSGLMSGSSATKSISLDLTGKSTLRLVVTDGGNGKDSDHADWADARVVS